VVDIPTRNNIGEHLLALLPDIQKAAVVFCFQSGCVRDGYW